MSIADRAPEVQAKDLRIHVTRFPSLTSPGKAICVGTTWHEWSNSIVQRGCPELQDKLKGELLNGCRLAEGGARGNKSVLEVSLIPIDLDHVEPEELEATLDRLDVEGLAYVCHSTHSDGNDGKACARIWLPLAHPLAASAFKPVWQATIDKFAPSGDRQCNDVGRGYFLPYSQPGRSATAFIFAREGRAYEPMVSAGAPRPALRLTSGTREVSAEVLVDVAKKWKRLTNPKKIDLADRLIRASRGESFAATGERDGIFFSLLNEIVGAYPDISSESLRSFFARSIDRMQMEDPEGALTLDAVDDKLSRIREYAAEQAVRYVPFEGPDTHDRFAANFYAENSNFRIFRGDYYRGNVRIEQEVDVRVDVGKFLRRFSVDGEPVNADIRRVSEVTEALTRTQAYVSGDVPCYIASGKKAPRCIVFKNGMLDIETDTWYESDPDLFAPYALPWDFNPGQFATPRWIKFLKEIGFAEDSIALLQEWYGYVLSGATDHQKFMWIQGLTRSGKSLITNMLAHLMGKSNVGACDAKQLASQFGLASHYDKSLLIMSELLANVPKETAARIKAIVGRDDMCVERKGREDLKVKFPARIMCTSNALPIFEDTSGKAIIGRLMILRTTVSFLGREDFELEATILAEEASGIVRWGLEGLKRLRANKKFSEPQSSFDCKARIAETSSLLHQFVAECELDAQGKIPLQTFCNIFRDWQVSIGEKEKSSQSAIEGMIENASINGVAVVRRREGALRKYYVTGLRMPAASDGLRASICEWIVKWLMEPRVVLSPAASHKLCVVGNKPIVNVGVIAENWGTYLGQYTRPPATAQIGLALESISEGQLVAKGGSVVRGERRGVDRMGGEHGAVHRGEDQRSTRESRQGSPDSR